MCADLNIQEQKLAIKALKASLIDVDVIIRLEGTTHLVNELREGTAKLASQPEGL